ncbi:hypothetical protein MauCBS54593_002411 [Microsporum audouinii]
MATREHRRSGIWDGPRDQENYYYNNYSYYDPYRYSQTSYYSTPRTYSSNSNRSSRSNRSNSNTISPEEARRRARHLASPSADDGELPDIIIFKYRNEAWSFEYPAFSIDDGRLHISDLRRLAGETLHIGDTSRIKLMYKGRLLNDDDASAKSQGLKQFSEVVAIVMPGYTEGVYRGGSYYASSNMVDGWREAELIPVSDSEEDEGETAGGGEEEEEEDDEEEEEDERYYFKSSARRGRSPPPMPARQERRPSVRRERKPRDPSPVSPDRGPRLRTTRQTAPPVREPARETAPPKQRPSPKQTAPKQKTSKYQYPTPPFPSSSPVSFDPLPNICREPRPYATSYPSPSASSTASTPTYPSDSTSASAFTAASAPPTPHPTSKPEPSGPYSVPNRPPTPCPDFKASQTSDEKLSIFETHVKEKLLPLCYQFMLHPPADARLRLKEQKRLNEAIERVLARADEITVGDSRPLRDRRKSIVQLIQRSQGRMDDMVDGR